jgi:hypothetical protein
MSGGEVRLLFSVGIALLAACADSATSRQAVQPPGAGQGRAPNQGESLVRVVQPRRPGQENFLTRATFVDGRLWLLSDAGELSSIIEGTDARVGASLPERALEICTRNGHIEAVTCAQPGCKAWTLRRWADDRWSVAASIASRGDDFLALDCAATTTVLTSRRIVEATGAGEKSVPLSEDLEKTDHVGVTSALVTADQIFVGLNRGEWGGGLRRIDRRTGKLTVVESNVRGDLCGGPLNTACDPVNAIAPEPWKQGCVAATVGVVHFFPHGRIVEICGDRVRRIYFKAFDSSRSRLPSQPRSDEPFETVAFFGLAQVKDSLWASGIDGVYRLKGEDAVRFFPLPRFKVLGNIGVSFDLPGVILVLTGVNRRLSISGNVPMLVPR